MRQPQKLLEIVAQIYTVPGNAGRWTDVLSMMGERVDARAGGYLMIDPLDHHTCVAGQWGFTDAHRAAYEGLQGSSKDVRFKYMHRLAPGQAMFDFEHVPDRDEYDNNAWIQHEQSTLGIYWYMVACVSTHGLWHDIVTINRVRQRGPFDEDDRADLQALLPHLARAAELHRTVSRLEDRYGAVLSVLDKLLVGVVLLDRRQRIVVANRCAREACERSGALRIGPDGTLRAHRPEKDLELQRLLIQTSQTAQAGGWDDGGSLILSHRSAPGGLLAEVVPLRDDGFCDGDNVNGSAVFIVDPHQTRVASTEWLARLFRLTDAEHQVAAQLINGADTRRIAEQYGKSPHTVRTQLKSIFAKTGARSQLELVRLAFKADPPIEDPGSR